MDDGEQVGRSTRRGERDRLPVHVIYSMVIRPATTALLRAIRQTSPSHLHHYPYRLFFTSPPNFSSTMSEFYNLKTKLPGDKEYDFEQLKGKVVLVVNVASKW